ncbi:Fibroblast growth factor receptor 3 [Zootermopsis nevadensis]|uniref:receptor protein-tyrosine kinase n=1 Tax=Zootermopsis nevadensis TaxID=136037 RepID=A0A067RFI1_ZOONE|nr:Fibroblast growth factor receptor 3 [Zootermopsis nevadensis]
MTGETWQSRCLEPSAEEVRQFRQEIIMMQSVGRHPNIVSLIGCCTSDDLLRLVVEYCAQGDLLNFLRKKWSEMMKSTERKPDAIVIQSETVKYAELLAQETTSEGESVNQFPGAVVNQTYGIENDDDSSQLWQELSPTDLLSFARQAAIGMEYLANNRVVHRDLAARNVLVCADRKVKISDFGLSRDIYEENVYHKKGSGRLPVRWMAPESLFRQVYNTQSDVWSFGILLWEIVTLGANPYPGIPTNKLPEYLREGHRMECPENCSNELYNIMFACWKAEPWQRPTFVELHKMLDDLLENSCPQKYLNLDVIDYMSELTFYQQEEQQSRNNGSRYLISNMNRTTGPDDNIPASPFIEDRKHYLSTSIKTKYINTSSNVDEEKD